MKVYIAASYPRKDEAKHLAVILESHGHTIVSGWLDRDEGYKPVGYETAFQVEKRLKNAALRDKREVESSGVVICLSDSDEQLTKGGRHCEFGMGVALDKLMVLIGRRENVIHYLDTVHNFKSVDEFIPMIVELLK